MDYPLFSQKGVMLTLQQNIILKFENNRETFFYFGWSVISGASSKYFDTALGPTTRM